MKPRRSSLLPLIPLYSAALQLKQLLLARGLLPTRTLLRPVLSVGSLSAGGAGKTPVVLMLADLLRRHQISVDVLSRGYGRSSSLVEAVVPAGSSVRFGDEPLQIARAGFPVVVGANRHAAGLLAERLHIAGAHLLDDGFQHRKLARQLDIVLLTQADANDCLLPAGNLREPLSALARAQVVVLREDEAESLTPVVRAHTTAEIWVVRRTLLLPPPRPVRPLVFCAIARPESFVHMLRDAGIAPAASLFFRDHHRFTPADIRALVRRAKSVRAEGFFLTAKDAVKIAPEELSQLEQIGPALVANLSVTLRDEQAALRTLRAALHSSVRK